MRRAAKVDDNQREIVEALRAAGCVVSITSSVGHGFPDLAVGRAGKTFLLECKNGNLPPSRQALTHEEKIWHINWRGHAAVVNSPEQALRAVGL